MKRIALSALAAALVLTACSSAGESPPRTVDDPEGVLTVVVPPSMRSAIAGIDKVWTEEGNDPLRVDFGSPARNSANHLQGALTAAAPDPVASDVVITENERTLESAEPSLWTDAGVVARTELRLVLPADRHEDAELTEDELPVPGTLAVCGDYCGEVAEEWLRAAGSDTVSDLLTFEDDVVDLATQVRAEDFADLPAGSGERAVRAVVDREVDQALAYRADAVAVRGDDAWPVDEDFRTVRLNGVAPLELTALVSDGRDTEEAMRFVEWLRTGPGAEILESDGFDAP